MGSRHRQNIQATHPTHYMLSFWVQNTLYLQIGLATKESWDFSITGITDTLPWNNAVLTLPQGYSGTMELTWWEAIMISKAYWMTVETTVKLHPCRVHAGSLDPSVFNCVSSGVTAVLYWAAELMLNFNYDVDGLARSQWLSTRLQKLEVIVLCWWTIEKGLW